MANTSNAWVSTRNALLFEPHFKQVGKSFKEVCDASGVDFARLKDSNYRIEWPVYVRFLSEIEKSMAPVTVEQYSRDAAKVPEHRSFIRMLGYFTETRTLYWALTRLLGPKLFPFVKYRLEDIAPGKLRLTIEIPDELDGSAAFFKFWLGGWQGTPRILGQRDALVEADIQPHRAVYEITLPPSLTFWSRLRRAWRVFFAAREALEELADTQKQLRAHFEQRLAVEKVAAERDASLKMFEKLEGMSKWSALGEMAGGMAHELNNPLAIVRLLADSMRERLPLGQLPQQELTSGLERITKMTSRMATIINSLLLFSKDASKDPIEVASVSKIVSNTLALCSERFRAEGVSRVEATVPEDLDLECRPIQISQVLLSLLYNAYESVTGVSQEAATGEKWIRIECRLAGEAIEISITDSGRGVPPHLRDRLFQPFFTTKNIGKGAGLGLSTAKGIVEAHGGKLSLDPAWPPTRFVVQLPRHAKAPFKERPGAGSR